MKIERDMLMKMAKDREQELIKLTSDLIKINSENPTGSQREVIDFVKEGESDGFLVGRASLDAKKFVQIINNVENFK